MRKTMTCVMAVALVAGLLSGCSGGPNQEAVEAASTYRDELSDWAAELTKAGETARTATPAEWEAAGEGELGFEEVGLGEVLESGPHLKEFESSEVENTPTYRTAARVAEQVDTITEELSGMEPNALETLRVASFDSYWVVADLYYNTLGGPAADRLSARSESLDHLDDMPTFYRIQRAASLAFAEQRLEFLGVAVKELGGTAVGEDRPIIPQSGLGASIGAFMVDWLHEEKAFQADMIEEIGSWTTLGGPYDTFWNYGNMNDTFTVPLENAAALRAAFVAQIGELATVLSETTGSTTSPTASPSAPSLGDPYRQVLLDGYLPWGDAAEGQEHTAGRLWMLWRIRELEQTSDSAYAAARAALTEELNRAVEDAEGIDFRPGSGRLLASIEAYSNRHEPTFDAAENEDMLLALQEVHGFGEALSRYPMTADIDADFDAVLNLYAEHIERISAVLADEPDGHEQGEALFDLSDEYQEKILDAADGALGALDDDAQAEALTAAAIEGTAPGAITP